MTTYDLAQTVSEFSQPSGQKNAAQHCLAWSFITKDLSGPLRPGET